MLNSREMQQPGPEFAFRLSSAYHQSALFFETPAEIYGRVFRELKPRTEIPGIHVEFRRYANADSSIRLDHGRLHVKIADILEGAPAPIMEALAYILLGKLTRRPIARLYAHRYRLYLNRRDMRHKLELVRQIRGRKFLSGPQGTHCNLDELFEDLNRQYFDGLLGRPSLGWSRRPSRAVLGHFDPSHNAIIISRIFDDPSVPEIAIRYVMFHEMLHLKYPVDHSRSRRRVHTRDFHLAEKAFERLAEAKESLKKL